MQQVYCITKDIFDENGWKIPETLDEFYKLLPRHTEKKVCSLCISVLEILGLL